MMKIESIKKRIKQAHSELVKLHVDDLAHESIILHVAVNVVFEILDDLVHEIELLEEEIERNKNAHS